MKWAQKQKAFTIVELLIVVVVIAILAAITIVAYNGVTRQAQASVAQASVADVAKQLETQKLGVGTEQYPVSLSAAGLSLEPNLTYDYIVNNNVMPASFCLVARNADESIHYSTQTGSLGARDGECKGYNYAVNGSAEQNLNQWNSTTGAAFERSSVRASDGGYSVRIWDVGTGSDSYVSYAIPNMPLGAWTFSADVYVINAGPTDYSRGVWLNGGPTNVVYWHTPYNQTTALHSWQTFTQPVSITVNRETFVARFYVMSGYNIYVDNVRFVKG